MPRTPRPQLPVDGTLRSRASLASRFDPRANSLGVLRVGLATLVAADHAISFSSGRQPGLGHTDLGALAVDGFFVLSGFLVTRSYLNLGSLRRFVWHRFLRIMPGFWVCLLLTAAVAAPLAAALLGRDPGSVFTTRIDPAQHYVVENAALLMHQWSIAGLPAGTSVSTWNGPLWTLWYEATCYAMVVLLGLAGVLRRRTWCLLALIAVLWVHEALGTVGRQLFDQEYFPRFALMFLLGAAGYVFASRIRINGALALLSATVVVLASLVLEDYRAVGGAPFAYLCLWAAVSLPVRRSPRWDLSYGMYIYHYPIQQLTLMAGASALSPGLFVPMSLLLAAAAAAVSWYVVERPALALKDAHWVTAWPSWSVFRARGEAPVRQSTATASQEDLPAGGAGRVEPPTTAGVGSERTSPSNE